jgi:3-oxoacyl-[acyl-carrier-protein] synthase II
MADWRPSGRVVVTGIGAVTPLGIGVEDSWRALVAGESGIGPVTRFDASDYPTRIAGEVKGFEAADFMDKKEARRVDRFIAFGAAAAQMAVQDAGFPEDDEVRVRTGVLIGSGIGGLDTMFEQVGRIIESGPGRVSPFFVPYMIPDMASGYVSIVHGFRGPNTCVVTACATGTNSIGDAFEVIRRGGAVAMVAGGCEAPIGQIALAGFCAARAMSTRNEEPQRASRPFDKERDGFVIAEGAGVLVLEDYEFAKSRGAKMYGEIVGYGMTGDAYHITAPDPQGFGAYRSMKAAMAQAGVSADQVDYINAHGTSTELNDKLETAAVKQLMGERAYKVPISSTKSMHGHMLGAAGAVEALVCLLAIRDGSMPPTVNYENPDPECDLDYIPNTARKGEVNVAMSNSFGFGGHNATLIVRRV